MKPYIDTSFDFGIISTSNGFIISCCHPWKVAVPTSPNSAQQQQLRAQREQFVSRTGGKAVFGR